MDGSTDGWIHPPGFIRSLFFYSLCFHPTGLVQFDPLSYLRHSFLIQVGSWIVKGSIWDLLGSLWDFLIVGDLARIFSFGQGSLWDFFMCLTWSGVITGSLWDPFGIFVGFVHAFEFTEGSLRDLWDFPVFIGNWGIFMVDPGSYMGSSWDSLVFGLFWGIFVGFIHYQSHLRDSYRIFSYLKVKRLQRDLDGMFRDFLGIF